MPEPEKKNLGFSWSPWTFRLAHICKPFDLQLRSACWPPNIIAFSLHLFTSVFFLPFGSQGTFVGGCVAILIQVSVDRSLQAYCTVYCCAKSLLIAWQSGLPVPPTKDATFLHSPPSSLTFAQKTEVGSLVAGIKGSWLLMFVIISVWFIQMMTCFY